MRKRFLIAIAFGVVLSMLVAVPAGARQPARGVMDLQFNEGFGTSGPCSVFSWAGTIDFRGEVYGFADMPTAPPLIGPNTFHFREDWMLFETPFTFDANGVITDCSGAPILWGRDKGVLDNNTGKATASGRIKGVDPAYFPAKWVGQSISWRGVIIITPQGRTGFVGPFRIHS